MLAGRLWDVSQWESFIFSITLRSFLTYLALSGSIDEMACVVFCVCHGAGADYLRLGGLHVGNHQRLDTSSLVWTTATLINTEPEVW